MTNLPYSVSMEEEIRKATVSLANLFGAGCIEDKAIPTELITNCRGLAFLTVAKGGMVFCPKVSEYNCNLVS